MIIDGIIDEENFDFLLSYEIRDRKICFEDFSGTESTKTAVIDTGYQGRLMIPQKYFSKLDVQKTKFQQPIIDVRSQRITRNVFNVEIEVNNETMTTTAVFFENEFLIGSEFLVEKFISMFSDFKNKIFDLEAKSLYDYKE